MRYRALGHTGIKVSELSLGTVKFGRNTKVKYPQEFAIPDMDCLQNLLALAADLGINTLDTAPAYGLSEARLGQLLAGQRHSWVLVAKAGEELSVGNIESCLENLSTADDLMEKLRRRI